MQALQKTVKILQVQYNDRTVDIPVACSAKSRPSRRSRRLIEARMDELVDVAVVIPTVQETAEVPQRQDLDRVVDVHVGIQGQVAIIGEARDHFNSVA